MQFIDLAAQQRRIRDKIDARIASVLDAGNYIMGSEVREFETALGAFCGSRFALGCANGTDALQLALMALQAKAGDAVFCPSFTFAATAEVVPLVGATPVFVDVLPDTFNLDVASLKRAILEARRLGLRPAGIIPVDLFGLPADYDAIAEVAEAEGLWILADSAQGFGALYKGRTTGSIGTVATTSFFPAKPLGCYGDGGAVFTQDEETAALIESFRVHGKGLDKYDNERVGLNSRLDTIQAAILLEKLAIYPDEIERRDHIAARYSAGLADVIDVPVVPSDCRSVWAQYTVKTRQGQERAAIMDRLKASGIPSMIYYPLPLHQQKAYRNFPSDPEPLTVSETLSKQVFSLPMHPYLDADQDRVIEALRKAVR